MAYQIVKQGATWVVLNDKLETVEVCETRAQARIAKRLLIADAQRPAHPKNDTTSHSNQT